MPRVSVIVPNYNHAQYLDQRIGSILNQTFQDFELIILDDCSTDNSREIIEKYADHHKIGSIVFNEINSGSVFKQWEKGISLAKGNYIWIAESDDWCELNLLQILVDAVENNPECILAYAQTYAVIGDNKIEKVSSHNKLSEYIDGKEYVRNYLTESCSIWNSGMAIFKKAAYLNIGTEFTTFKMSGDWILYAEIAKQGMVYVSGRVLNYFRKHENNTSLTAYDTGNNYVDELRILKKIRDEKIISYKEYKGHLLSKYIRYRVFKYKFAQAVKDAIEAEFFTDAQLKSYLERNSTISLLKIRAKRRLNLILDKI
jgi:glycosyltransferase involved in cell wall biosynthesis